MKSRALGFAAAAIATYAIPAFAHHSFAMFDADKKMTLEGTVKEFQWTNPHSWILMTVGSDQWSIEMGAPGKRRSLSVTFELECLSAAGSNDPAAVLLKADIHGEFHAEEDSCFFLRYGGGSVPVLYGHAGCGSIRKHRHSQFRGG